MNQRALSHSPDYFAEMVATGDSPADVVRFYHAVNRPETLAHVTAVAAEARALAGRHGLDAEAASLAALAHDMASLVPAVEMTTVAQRMGIKVTDADRAMPALLHGPIAAAALADKLDVTDGDVLNAVRYHTTLRAGAGELEKIVFLADKLAHDPSSPHRGEYVPALRAAASLDEAILVYLDFLLDNAWRFGIFPHPNSLAAYRELVGRRRRSKTSLPCPACIVSVVDESARVKTLTLDLQLQAKPGQFVMAWLPGLDEKPFSLVTCDPVTLTVARVGPFSKAIHRLSPGDPIWLRGPLGNPFTIDASAEGGSKPRALLVAGGYGVAPLYFLAGGCLRAGWEVVCVIGAQTAADVVFAERFADLGVQVAITTDDGSLGEKGLATGAAARILEAGRGASGTTLYACGPEPMLDVVEALARTHSLPAQLSYERYMRCGFGVCGSCSSQGWLVCRDGPVKHIIPGSCQEPQRKAVRR